jgi:hypothetical protein
METKLKMTRLVQRLCAPRVKEGQVDALAKAFSFGGGGGRLTEKAWEMLSPIFHFDYMGAAEFEFGAVPQALLMMSEMKLTAFVLKTYTTQTPVYVLCDENLANEIIDRIQAIAKGEECQGNEIRLHEKSYFLEALTPVRDFDKKFLGWLELDNGFFWTTNLEMWRKFAKVFGLSVGILA